MYDHDFEQKCRGMVLRDTILRVLTYTSMAVLVVTLALVSMNRYPGAAVWFELGAALFCILCCVLLWQNLRCPHCGKLLVNYHAAVYSRPKHCVSCGTVIRWKKRDEYDLQPIVRETVERPGTTEELTAQCREIARRDRVLRPMLWFGFAALVVMMILLNGGPLPDSLTNVLAVICCIYVSVVGILWAHNLCCPACKHHLTGKYTRNRISLLELPDVHICGYCNTRLPFQA